MLSTISILVFYLIIKDVSIYLSTFLSPYNNLTRRTTSSIFSKFTAGKTVVPFWKRIKEKFKEH